MTDQDIPETVVEFYWRPGCPYCAALRRGGLPMQEINIWGDPQAAARVRSVAGGNDRADRARGLARDGRPSTGQVLAAVRDRAPDLAAGAEPTSPGPTSGSVKVTLGTTR